MTTPQFMILADGIDVTIGFNDRLIEMTVTDYDGMQADDLKITLDDRDHALALPRKGAKLGVSMGTAESGLALMGLFEVKGRKRHFDKSKGRVMEIRAKSADLRASLKQPRTGAYEATTYGGLAQEVAQRHGLTAKVSPSIADIKIGYEAQSEESDLHLMTRLSRDVDAICKIANGQLIVLSRDDLEMAPLVLAQTDFIECSVEDDDRAQHKNSSAHYHDRGKANRGIETESNDDADLIEEAPEYMLRHTFETKERAKAAAKGRMRALQRDEKRLSGKMSGNNKIMAGLPVVIDWGVELYDGGYTLKRVEHKIGKGDGYTTTISTDKGKGKKGGKGK